MKIRNGFVSNSSSTSFCIWGVYVENGSSDEEKLKSYLLQQQKVKEYLVKYPDEDDMYELLDVADFKELYSVSGPDGDGIYLGREFASIRADETGAHFKESTQATVDKIFGEDVMKCCVQEESWRDG